jgi:hypothetical protein
MKLNNTKKTSANHSDKDSVYKQIAAKFGSKISLMLNLIKGEERSIRYNFHGPPRLGRMAGMIAAKVPTVKTLSDVYRAGSYLGISIIYHMLLKNPSEETKCFFDQCIECETISNQVGLIENCLFLVAENFYGHQNGIISWDQLQEKIDELVGQLPKSLQKIVHEKINQILNGVPLLQVSDVKRVGRPPKRPGYDEKQ